MSIALRLGIALLVLASQAAFVQAKSRHALLIANQAYAPAVGPLENPTNDVGLIVSALQGIGFQPVNIRVVRDGNRDQVMRALIDYATALARAGDDAIGFFYYSGHGVANADDRRNYLIPVDVARLDAYVWAQAISLERIVEILADRAPNAAQFVIFDACRDILRLPVRGTKGFAPVSEKRGMLIAFSTEPGGDGKRRRPAQRPLCRSACRRDRPTGPEPPRPVPERP